MLSVCFLTLYFLHKKVYLPFLDEIKLYDYYLNVDYEDYIKCTLYTTLSPCPMCSGAIILYNIPRVVIGENTTLMGAENLLKCNDVEVVVLNDLRCRDLFLKFTCNNCEIWDDELAKVGNTTEVK